MRAASGAPVGGTWSPRVPSPASIERPSGFAFWLLTSAAREIWELHSGLPGQRLNQPHWPKRAQHSVYPLFHKPGDPLCAMLNGLVREAAGCRRSRTTALRARAGVSIAERQLAGNVASGFRSVSDSIIRQIIFAGARPLGAQIDSPRMFEGRRRRRFVPVRRAVILHSQD
jgi:hypothetical protein